MSDIVTIRKVALVSLLDSLFNPNPDDPGDPNNPFGPFGPGGPVLRDRLLWVLLNPQPLPPKAGPQPDPWRLGRFAHALIDRVVAQYQFADVLRGTEQSERSIGAIRSYLRDVVDDWCGTRPPKWPWPWPPRMDMADLQPIELLVAGAQFHKAAAFESPLQSEFAAAADNLLEAGLRRTESCCCS